MVNKCLENKIWVINIGSNFVNSKRAVEIAENSSYGVFASIGLHPINLDTGLVKIKIDPQEGKHFEKEFDYQKYKKLSQSKKVVAVGEIGLDYYWKPKTFGRKQKFFQEQKSLLLKQLELAQELSLPVIFHCRMAHEDLLEILKAQKGVSGVVHCFTGTWEQAQQYMDMELYLGFNGIIFKLNLDEIIKKTPLERALIETDCPYLSPPEFEGQRNEPIHVKYIAQRIAEIKNTSFDKVAEITTNNAKKLFNL